MESGGLIEKNVDDRDYINNKIYKFIFGNPCVMLADGDSLMGCTSAMKGTVGVLYPVNSTNTLQTFLAQKEIYGVKDIVRNIEIT